MHWFFNKTGMAGTIYQMINGLFLMASFAGCRLIWGSWLTLSFVRDAWTAVAAKDASTTIYDYSPIHKPLHLTHQTPWWVAAAFMAANTTILALSAYWFAQMVTLARKSFATDKSGKKKQ